MQEFEADTTIEAMMRSNRWPRGEYLKNLHDTTRVKALSTIPEAQLLYTLLRANVIDNEAVAHCLQKISSSSSTPSTLKELAKDFVMSPDDIKNVWEANRIRSSWLGTWMHAQCECILNGGHIVGQCTEMMMFATFIANTMPLLAYRTEWCIWATDEKIAGAIDFVAENANGNLVFLVQKRGRNNDKAIGTTLAIHLRLFDWKRSSHLREKYHQSWGTTSITRGTCELISNL